MDPNPYQTSREANVKRKWPKPPRFWIPSVWLVLAAIEVIVIIANLLGIARHR